MSIFGGGHHAAAKSPTRAMGLDFQGAQYGRPIPVVYGQNKVAGNCIWYGDFQAIAVQQKQSGGKGGGGSSSTTSYDYKASYQLGICEGVGNIVNVYNGTSTVSLASLGAVVATGTQGQAPWAHLSGNAALGYSGTVVVSFQNRDLGSSASLPNDNFEVAGLAQFGGGIVDANPAAILSDICTNQYYGINFGQLGSTTQYSNYCVAAGLFMSPVFDSQSTGQQALSELLKYTNADAWFSEGQLKIGCYGDQSLTGNGATYTPNNTAVADLTAADFITNGSAPPVTISRKSPADAFNIERLEFTDRANTYHTSAVVASLDYSVVKSGARADKSDTYHGITTSAVARLVAQNLVQRDFYVRNSYQFRLSWRYCYLEPFDIVTLTDANTGLQSTPVRITEVSEDEHGLLAITAEEFPLGIGHGGTYSTQANGGTTVDPNTDPGPVAAPYLFRGPGFLVGNNAPEIWCAVTGNGNPLWSGCDVYLSHDGTSYTFLSTYARQARYGELTNSMGVQADPDSTSAPNVVLNGYNTQLLGGTQADADNFTTLAMIDSEIVSYETATLASGPSYNLSYLRRGAYGSTIAAHAANAPFVRLDDGILRIPVDPSQIGQTIYIKFLSRNCFGRTPRTLAGETAYTYVIGTNVELPDVPDVPASLAVTAVADGVQITWTNDNPAAVGCTSIEYATASTGPWTVLAQVGPTTTGFHHAFTTGSTYYYRARARGPLVQSGWSAYTATLSSAGKTVQNGATNGATIGPGGNVNGAVDGNGRALIDFSYGGHLYKILDNIGDGATYGRPYLSRLNGGRPWIDFSEGIHANKTFQYIPDGGGRYAVTNAGGLNGVSSVDANNRAGIDFTQTLHIGKSLANMPDDATSGRYAVSNIDGNRRALIDATQAGHVGAWNLDSRVADGTTYARTSSGALTGGNVDLAKAGVVNKNLGNIADGGGRYGVHAVDGNNLALVDFSQAGHVNKTLDYMPNGAIYRSVPQSATEAVDNASFELPQDAQGHIPGWTNVAGATASLYTTQHYVGSQCISLTSTAAGGNVTSKMYDCSPNDGFLLSAAILATSGSVGNVALQFFDGANNFLGQGGPPISNSANNWLYASQPFSAPVNAVKFNIALIVPGAAGQTAFFDAIGLSRIRSLDNQVADGTIYMRMPGANMDGNRRALIDFSQSGHVNKNLDNIGDGVTNGRMAMADVFNVGGANRVGLRVAGSGHQLGDQFNSPPIASANLRSTWTGQTISYSATAGSPATATISVTAATLLAGAASKAYNAMSVGVSGTGGNTATYYLYFDDPTYAGGAQTLVATTTGSNIYGANGRVYVGSIAVTFPTSGSGSGGGSGGGGACVALGTYGPQGRFDRETRCVYTPDGAVSVRKFKTSHQKCVRVKYDNGTVLTCSEDAPLMGGQRKVLAIDALGETLDTSKGSSRVRSVESAGILEVVSIDAGDVAYYAGDNPDGPFALHHNKIIP